MELEVYFWLFRQLLIYADPDSPASVALATSVLQDCNALNVAVKGPIHPSILGKAKRRFPHILQMRRELIPVAGREEQEDARKVRLFDLLMSC